MAQRTASAGIRASRVQSSRPPRRARPSSRTRNEVGRRLTGYVLRFAVNRIVEQRRHRNDEPGHPSSGSGHGHGHGHGGGSAMGHAVTNALLEELIQEVIEFIVRHNFFLGGSNNNEGRDHTEAPTGGDSQREEQPSQGSRGSSSQEERRRRRHRRRSEAMMHSLDRLSDELGTTYDATVRVLRDSAGEANDNKNDDHPDDPKKDDDGDLPAPQITQGIDESLRANLENLRRATTRCMARVESVRRGQHGSRRASRQRRAGRSAHLSRAGSSAMNTGSG